MGFSLYSRWSERDHKFYGSIIENSLYKKSGSTWTEWWEDLKDRRDMNGYIYKRFLRGPQF
jgi:hypothetical protein